jgi:hypothetical protein
MLEGLEDKEREKKEKENKTVIELYGNKMLLKHYIYVYVFIIIE